MPARPSPIQLDDGQTFRTRTDFCQACGISRSSLRAYELRGYSVNAVARAYGVVNDGGPNPIKRRWQVVTLSDGSRYRSRCRFACLLGVTSSTIAFRLNQGWTPDQIKEHYAKRKLADDPVQMAGHQ